MRVEDMSRVEKDDSISTVTTFTAKTCQETFKIQNGPLSLSDSEKVLYLLKCKVCDEVLYVGKVKSKIRYRFNNYKSKHITFKKVIRKFLRNYFTLAIASMAIAALKIGIL